ncbi:unnamed protein product [Trichobilharzia regenti]|nr:unnamed protein product [Trichobilharzia regenti]
MEKELSKHEKKIGIKITFSYETEAMGTAGPIALAKDMLLVDNNPFFVLNSDVMCEFPFKAIIDFHKSHGKEGTILSVTWRESGNWNCCVHLCEAVLRRSQSITRSLVYEIHRFLLTYALYMPKPSSLLTV